MENHTGFAPMIHVLPDRDAVDTLFVVVRGAFTLAAAPGLCDVQPPPLAADVYWGQPDSSSLKYAADVHVGKVGTDVALVGTAHAPRGRAVTEMLASVSVAGRRKVVRVVGDRTWRGVVGGATPPAPFVSMPLIYERAFGGRDEAGEVLPAGRAGADSVAAEERNPVGVGFRALRRLRWGAGVRLPNLEDPNRAWRTLGDRPPPASFGLVAPSWQPRRAFAGTYDDAWTRQRAPFLPRDFDLRFGNAASAGLTFDDGLHGGEPIGLDGVSREGRLQSAIPRLRPRVDVIVAGRRETPPVRLETVLIEPDEHRLSLTWRAALRCDKRALKLERIHVREEDEPCRAASS